MYRLYIGDYKKEGTPATWTIVGQVPKKHLKNRMMEVIPHLRVGMELYILTPTGEIKSYFRDNLAKLLNL